MNIFTHSFVRDLNADSRVYFQQRKLLHHDRFHYSVLAKHVEKKFIWKLPSHTRIYIYIYIYMCVCVCVCVYKRVFGK